MIPKVKVLIVDDEEEYATALAERLNIRDFEATAVFSSEDALALIHAQHIPDVILLDLKMPRMDGMESLAEIKKRNPTIEVILLTGHGTGVTLSGIGSEKHGAFDCIIKPASIKDIVEKINEAYAKRLAAETGEDK